MDAQMRRRNVTYDGQQYRTANWLRTRQAILRRDANRCLHCGAPASIVDHIVSPRNGGSDDPGNLRSLCTRCDNAVKEDASGQRRSGGRLGGCDANGNPLDPSSEWNR